MKCESCGASWESDEHFLREHPGPYALDALKAAKLHRIARCSNCPATVLSKANPT
jgi:hypothetical protein